MTIWDMNVSKLQGRIFIVSCFIKPEELVFKWPIIKFAQGVPSELQPE